MAYDLYYTTPCTPSVNANTVAWVQVLTMADVLPGAEETVRSQIPSPETEFQDLEPTFGWTFVVKATDFRVLNLQPISASASATAGPVTVSVTVTATPTKVVFYPGEPDGVAMACSVAGAQAPFVLRQPGLCSYRYKYSSAFGADGRHFTTTTVVPWTVTYVSTSGSGTLAPYESRSDQQLAVAEIQVLVTCTGPLPEQGGC